MGIYNGCGGEGGINFGKVVRNNIPLLPSYNQDKALLLWQGIEITVCKPHDIDFYRGGFILAYLIANAKFAYRFTIKFWWTNIIVQILLLPIIFIGLSIFGIKYFNWCLPFKKRKILPNKYNDENINIQGMGKGSNRRHSRCR